MSYAEISIYTVRLARSYTHTFIVSSSSDNRTRRLQQLLHGFTSSVLNFLIILMLLDSTSKGRDDIGIDQHWLAELLVGDQCILAVTSTLSENAAMAWMIMETYQSRPKQSSQHFLREYNSKAKRPLRWSLDASQINCHRLNNGLITVNIYNGRPELVVHIFVCCID